MNSHDRLRTHCAIADLTVELNEALAARCRAEAAAAEATQRIEACRKIIAELEAKLAG